MPDSDNNRIFSPELPSRDRVDDRFALPQEHSLRQKLNQLKNSTLPSSANNIFNPPLESPVTDEVSSSIPNQGELIKTQITLSPPEDIPRVENIEKTDFEKATDQQTPSIPVNKKNHFKTPAPRPAQQSINISQNEAVIAQELTPRELYSKTKKSGQAVSGVSEFEQLLNKARTSS